MKKFGKILSSVLAASMLVSSFAISAFAASTAHTATIKVDKTTGLKAGDVVTVELSIDNTEKLCAAGYILTYDANVFVADTTKVNRLENCIDSDWMSDIKNADGDWAYYLGNPTYNVAKAGEFNFKWAGAEGVEADYAMDNRVIGKFYLTVKEDAPNGNAVFTLTYGSTTDIGENAGANMVFEPVTVTVGEAAPTTKTVGLVATLKYDNTKTGVAFTVTDTVADLTSAPYQVSYAALAETTIENLAAITVGLNVTEVPKDSTLTATAELY